MTSFQGRLVFYFVLGVVFLMPYPGFLGASFLRGIDLTFLIALIIPYFFGCRFTLTNRSLNFLVMAFGLIFISTLKNVENLVIRDIFDFYKITIIFFAYTLGSCMSNYLSLESLRKFLVLMLIVMLILIIFQINTGGIFFQLYSGRSISKIAETYTIRGIGSIGNPNHMAVVASLILIVFLLNHRLSAIGIILAVSIVLLTQSRSTLILLCGFSFIFLFYRYGTYRMVKLLTVFIAVSWLISLFVDFRYLVSGLEAVVSGNLLSQSSFSGRLVIWDGILLKILENPFFGVGVSSHTGIMFADNSFLLLAYKYGLVFLGLAAACIVTIFRKVSYSNGDLRFGTSMMAIFILLVSSVGDFAESVRVMMPFSLFVGYYMHYEDKKYES